MNDGWLATLLVTWLGVSFFLNGMEAGVQSLSRLRIRQWLRAGRPGARLLLAYMDRRRAFFSALQHQTAFCVFRSGFSVKYVVFG